MNSSNGTINGKADICNAQADTCIADPSLSPSFRIYSAHSKSPTYASIVMTPSAIQTAQPKDTTCVPKPTSIIKHYPKPTSTTAVVVHTSTNSSASSATTEAVTPKP